MARRRLLAAVVGVLALGVPSALADMGGDPHDGSNGNGRPAEQTPAPPEQAAGQPQQGLPEQAAQPAQENAQAGSQGNPDQPAAPAHPAHPAHPATPNGPKDTPGDPGSPAHHGNPHANAGKITICHATGSDTNPYVEITISVNALPAHQNHQDGEDIVPAPAEGCPGGPEHPGPGHENGKITICHATGSATNPYVEITIDESGLNGHDGHDGDIIPAPAEGCPGSFTPLPPLPPLPPLVPPTDLHVLSALTQAPTTMPAVGVLGAETMSPVEISPSNAASPAHASAPEVAAAEVSAPKTANAGRLPFTGRDALLVALLGILLLGVGLTVRRLAAER